MICPADGTTTVDEAAVSAARLAFGEGPWQRTPARDRGGLLLRVANLLADDRDAVARAESLDTGKRLAESEYDGTRAGRPRGVPGDQAHLAEHPATAATLVRLSPRRSPYDIPTPRSPRI
ncbi:MAG TPA: aldehyde dehydrogenase family protein, partial [Streptosporangiaceae bacterium]|nr:aldehyde dehydrogenase family protein [Streptosporangiaceae bacterium]